MVPGVVWVPARLGVPGLFALAPPRARPERRSSSDFWRKRMLVCAEEQRGGFRYAMGVQEVSIPAGRPMRAEDISEGCASTGRNSWE